MLGYRQYLFVHAYSIITRALASEHYRPGPIVACVAEFYCMSKRIKSSSSLPSREATSFVLDKCSFHVEAH